MKHLISTLLVLCLLIVPFAALADDTPQIGYINIDTKVYMDASEKAIVSANVALGTQVRVEEEAVRDGASWYFVTFLATNETGWVRADDVDLVIAKRAITVSPALPGAEGAVAVTNESAFPVLTASGVYDPDELLGAPQPSDYRLINIGDTGDDVMAVKNRLYELRFSEGSYGNAFTTTEYYAIIRFQRTNGLEQDGVCSPELQAKLFSVSALNSSGQKATTTDALTISNGTVSSYNNNNVISFYIRNTSGKMIDAFDFTLRLYNTYGERFLVKNIVNDITLQDEMGLFDFSEERSTLYAGQTATYQMSMGDYYFAGCMIAITAYHTTDGETVAIEEDQRHWFAFGKGVTAGYHDTLTTPLTDLERERADAWSLGIKTSYVDPEIAAVYGLREGSLIHTITPGSVADAAGLHAGDVLLAIGDVRIFGGTSISRAKAALSPGESAVLLYLRNGVVYQTTLTVPGGVTAI